MKIALTILSENPRRKTGLTSFFHEFVLRGLKIFPDISWLIFAGPQQEWDVLDHRVEINRDFRANDHLGHRLLADHLQVSPAARSRGADVLVTVGFVPARKSLPTAMHILSLQALDKRNRIGLFREMYRRWMIKFSWPKADLVFVNSRWTASQVLSLYPTFQDRLIVSYEGLQHEIFNTVGAPGEPEQLKERFGITPGYFLWLSNFYPYKQAELLIAGYARLDPEMRRRHPLVMAGGDWLNGLGAARAQARSLGVESDVKFLGWIDDRWVAPLYRHAATFCLASREETFGRCVIEAMACGTPCVVNNIPVMHEVTEGLALIVDFLEVEAVSGALQKISTDSALVSRLRDGGLARARQFTFEKLATERITAIRRLVSSRSQPRH
jgi:glycosyltransferase involved in cell wall biosynthesis